MTHSSWPCDAPRSSGEALLGDVEARHGGDDGDEGRAHGDEHEPLPARIGDRPRRWPEGGAAGSADGAVEDSRGSRRSSFLYETVSY